MFNIQPNVVILYIYRKYSCLQLLNQNENKLGAILKDELCIMFKLVCDKLYRRRNITE